MQKQPPAPPIEKVKEELKEKAQVAEVAEEKHPADPLEEVKKEIDFIKPAEIDAKTGQLILTPKHLELIKTQIAKDATKQEFELFIMMAYRTRLDPLMKQLYFIKYGQGEKAKVSYVTSIDGYRIIAHRTGLFGGIDEPVYQRNPQGQATHCTIRVYKVGSDRPFAATVKMSEYSTGQNLWAKMPETMLAKVAEAHALRKAFPQDLSGIYTTDEMEQSMGQEKPKFNANNRLVSPQQIARIYALLPIKGKTNEGLHGLIQHSFKVDSVKKLTIGQANGVIKKLESLPDVIEADPIPDDAEFMDAVENGLGEQVANEVPF